LFACNSSGSFCSHPSLQVFLAFGNIFDADDGEDDADDRSVLKLQNPYLRHVAGGGPRDGMDDADPLPCE
jgi:hypothetical protein